MHDILLLYIGTHYNTMYTHRYRIRVAEGFVSYLFLREQQLYYIVIVIQLPSQNP